MTVLSEVELDVALDSIACGVDVEANTKLVKLYIAELETDRDLAYDHGYDAGFADGDSEGYNRGYDVWGAGE
jgi:hypothetical protein